MTTTLNDDWAVWPDVSSGAFASVPVHPVVARLPPNGHQTAPNDAKPGRRDRGPYGMIIGPARADVDLYPGMPEFYGYYDGTPPRG